MPAEDIHAYYLSKKEHVSLFLDEDIMNDVVQSVLAHLAKSKDVSNTEDEDIVILDSDTEARLDTAAKMNQILAKLTTLIQ